MNKIIWKGIDTSIIDGLMICELPPITKPKMRFKETKVDGVDGSIIEELGYESYDKTIKIGLYKNLDIDTVIEYFTGEGEVIFSNEPDKYYNAKIIEKIDYERLLRFKTADIKFRVQPFKYKLDEEPVTTGEERQVEKYIITNGLYQGTLLETEDEGGSWEVITTFIQVEPNQNYILAGTLTQDSWAISVYFYDENETLLEEREIIENNSTFEFTTPSGTKYIKFDGYTPIIDISTVSLKYITTEIESVYVVNNLGNAKSKPIIKIIGSGSVETIVNNKLAFTYTFPENENEVYIDSEKQDAYFGSVLKNRNMIGEFPLLETGENTIKFNGNIASIEIIPKSRWL